MALKKDIEFQGVPVSGAYHKINQVNVVLGSLYAVVTVDVYASEERAGMGIQERIQGMEFPLTLPEIFALSGKKAPQGIDPPQIEATNPLEWCYKWLMAKPEFEKAEIA